MRKSKGSLFIIFISITSSIFIIILGGLFIFSNNSREFIIDIVVKEEFTKVTKEMLNKKINNTYLYYEGDIEEKSEELILKSIEDGKVICSEVIQNVKEDNLNIVVFKEKDKFIEAMKESSDAILSVYIGNTIYIPEVNISERIIVHEYAHYRLKMLCDDYEVYFNEIPSWFKEGISEYISLRYSYENFKLERIEQKYGMRNLENNEMFNEAVLKGFDPYYESCYVIYKIIEVGGADSISNIIKNSKVMDFYGAVEKEINMSIDQLEKLY